MIYLECYNDEALVRGLGVPRRMIEHEHGKSLVASALKRDDDAGAIGLVDQDPLGQKVPYLSEFKPVELQLKLGLALFRHPKDQKTYVEIQPDLEPWLYQAAKSADMRPEDHQLPTEYRRLHEQPMVFEKRVRVLVEKLVAAGSPHLRKLHEWLRPI